MNPPAKWFFYSGGNTSIIQNIRANKESQSAESKILIPITFQCLKKIKPFLIDFFRRNDSEYKNVVLIFVVMHDIEKEKNPEKSAVKDIQKDYTQELNALAESYQKLLEHYLASQPMDVRNKRLKIFRKILFFIPHFQYQKDLSRHIGFYPRRKDEKWTYLPGFIFLDNHDIIQKINVAPSEWEVRHTLEELTSNKRSKNENLPLLSKSFFLWFNHETMKWNISYLRVFFLMVSFLVVFGWIYVIFAKRNRRNTKMEKEY